MGEELVDFQTALQDLQMTEAELSNLVARGELRVIRSGGKPMFRPADIQGLKQERETDPTIIIPASAPQADPAQSGPITIDLPEDIGDLDESAATVVASASDNTPQTSGTGSLSGSNLTGVFNTLQNLANAGRDTAVELFSVRITGLDVLFDTYLEEREALAAF